MSQINKIKIGIVGYGNLGKGVELAVKQNPDIELVAIFTRRTPTGLGCSSLMVPVSQIEDFRGKIDVMILCGGSSTDLPEQGPKFAKMFNTVDSFDTHAKIPKYFNQVDDSSKSNKTLSLISTGWDPGLFSLARVLGQSILPVGEDYTFWGKGVSQGHSDAIRRVPGVKKGIQYTIPVESALKKVRSGENPKLATSDKHVRVCYVVADEGADLAKIEHSIKQMPNYFNEYETTVNFIAEEELKTNHSGMPHGGVVIRSGITGNGTKQRIEFNLNLESNPEFTGNVLVAYARAIGRMAKEGQTGARTVFDIPPALLSPLTGAELREKLL
jgi:diaminopimelate dehydrogenase